MPDDDDGDRRAGTLVTRVLPRGNWQDESGENCSTRRATFSAADSESGRAPVERLDLARWLVSPENPLTARAVMNRLWKQFFGAGLSAVVDDLGVQGNGRCYPDYWDWLAVAKLMSRW